MKKLLYTFLLGVLVVSCTEKYEESFEAPQLSGEIIVSDIDHDFDASIGRLLETVNSLPKQPSAAKAATDGSYVIFLLGSQGDNEYEIFYGDDVELCTDGGSVDFLSIYLVYKSASSVEIRLSSVDGTLLGTIDRDLTNIFEFDNLFLGDKISGGVITSGTVDGATITFE